MRRILLIISLILISAITKAQTSAIDSIKNLIAKNKYDDSNKVLLLVDLSNALFYIDSDSMMNCANDALALSKKIKWQRGIAHALRVKGIAYLAKNDPDIAMNYFHQALDANTSVGDKNLEYKVANSTGVLFFNQKQYSEALKYYKNALAILAEMNTNKSGEDILLLNIANTYYNLKLIDTANLYYGKALAIAENNNNHSITIGALNGLGTYYMDIKKDYAQAQSFFAKSLLLADDVNSPLLKTVCLINNANVKSYVNQLDSAEKYASEALQLAEQLNSMQYRREAWLALSNIYEKKGDYSKALIATKNSYTINDSMLSDENRQQLAGLESQYQFDKKENILKTAYTAKIERQQIIKKGLIAGGAIVILAACIILFYYKRRRDAEITKKEAEFRTEVIDNEMKVMRLQMNPHFIFNSLNSIGDYIANNESGVANQYLSKFAKVMRMTLENSEKKSVPLKDDLKALELYMQLEASRLNGKFDYKIQVAPEIDQENTMVPPMIFQPFVENSIWHGIAKKEGKGNILINITSDGEMLHCLIDDDGIGRKASAQPVVNKEKQSLGMKITKARIDIINKIKRSNATVQTYDLPIGMRVQVNLPLELNF